MFSPFILVLAAELFWGPYLQDVRNDRATVTWTTRGGAGTGSVRYFTPAGPADVRSTVLFLPAAETGMSEDVWLHRAALRGLEARTEYRYAVYLDGAAAADDPAQRIVTAGAMPFRFLAIGDTGDNGAGQRELAAALERETGAFLLHTGDIAYWDGTFDQFRVAYFGIYDKLLRHMAAFPTFGNHDEVGGGRAYRTLLAPERYYSFDWGNAHFAVLDSNQDMGPGTAMRAWLEQDLRATRQTWRIVSIHHPPFPTSDYKRADPVCAAVAAELTPLFERLGVHLVLSGHEHIYQRTKARRHGAWVGDGLGTVYVTTGGGGSQLYDPGKDAFLAGAAGGGHYLRITVDESVLRGEAVDGLGRVLDSWAIPAAPAILPEGVRDAAAFRTALAPGGLVSLFGWNLEGAALRDAARGWPVLYGDRTQINTQAPFEAGERETLTVSSRHGRANVEVILGTVAPAIFAMHGGRAAAIHLDGRLVEARTPAGAGEWISLYATGLGRVKGGQATGAAAAVAPLKETEAAVRVELGGGSVEASPAVLAPGFIGLYQINIRIPGGLGPGPHPLRLIAGGRAGNTVLLDVR